MMKVYDVKLNKTGSKNNKEEVNMNDYIKQIIFDNRN